jgi:O-antigen ligase
LEYGALAAFSAMLILAPYFRKPIKFIIYAGAALWLLMAIFRNGRTWYRLVFPANPLNLSILLFLTVCSLSVFFSIDPYHSQKVLFNRLPMYFVVFWLGSSCLSSSRRNFYVIVTALLVSGAILAIGITRDYLIFRPVRVFTSYGRDIPFCMLPLFTLYFVPFVYGFYVFGKSRFLKYFSFFNLILLIPCLIWTGSRATWVAVPISFIFISLFKSWKLVLKVMAVIVLFFAIGGFFPTMRDKIQSIPHPSEWNYRKPLFDSAFKMFRNKPILGTGLGMYELLVKKQPYTLPLDYPNPDHRLYIHAHSIYLEALAETGLAGLGAFMLIFIAYFAFLKKHTKDRGNGDIFAAKIGLAGIVLAVLIFGVSGSIITVGVNESIFFWFIFGAGSGLLAVPSFNKGKA